MPVNKIWIMLRICVLLVMGLEANAQNPGCVNVMDYINNSNGDVSTAIQKAIDDNPHRVIYFPDGVYKLSKPILTPADPHKSVALELSNYAIVQPEDGWKHEQAMICLGGKDPYNTILIGGSNYYLSGGVIDCRGKASAISIDCGRETSVRNVSIKNAQTGIHIKKGLNGGSSDADIFGVNITGNMDKNSVGILTEGHDNTITNVRIYRMQTGVELKSGANILRNVHALYGTVEESLYAAGIGFSDKTGNNWYDFCYSDQFATAFLIESGISIYHDCFAFWFSNRGTKHTAFRSVKPFNSIVTNFTMGVNRKNAVKENIILEEAKGTPKGTGRIQNLVIIVPDLITSDSYKKYTVN